MKNTGIRALAQQLQSMGRDGDTILAHIMPHEAAMLKRMGGRGSVNPNTGLLEFAGADPSGSSVTSSNYGGGSTYSGGPNAGANAGGMQTGGGGSISTGGGGGGSISTGGGGGGGSALSGFTGGGSSPGGVSGGGMLSTGTPTMVSSGGGDFAPMGGNSSSNFLQSLGVPTLVSNVMNAAKSIVGSAFDFSGPMATNPLNWAAPIAGTVAETMNTYFSSSSPAPTDPVVKGPDNKQYLQDPNGNLYTMEFGKKNVAFPASFPGSQFNVGSLSGPSGPEPESPTMVGGVAYDYRPSEYDLSPAYTPSSGIFAQPQGPTSTFGETILASGFPSTTPSGIPAPQPQMIAAADENRSPTDVSAPASTYDLAATSAFPARPDLQTVVASQPQMVAMAQPETALPSTTASATTFDMSKAIQDFRANLGAVRYGLLSLNTLGVNTPGSDNYMSDEAIAKAITNTLSKDPRLAGSIVGAGSGISADTPEVQAAIKELATSPYTIKDLGAYNENLAGKSMTLAPSTWGVQTGLSIPTPPERFSDTTVVASAQPEPVGLTTAAFPARPDLQGMTATAQVQDLPSLLDATFYQIAGGQPITREFGYPGQVSDINYAEYRDTAPSYASPSIMLAETTTPTPTPTVELAPRPPADLTPATQVVSLLEDEFNSIVSSGGGGGGGGGSYGSYRPGTTSPKSGKETVIPPAPVYTTGMNLQKRVYVPGEYLVPTTSPAYS